MDFNLLAGLFTSGTANEQGANPIFLVVMMVSLFAVMYFLTIRPQKKQQKRDQEMRESIQIGDEITTVGGIMGRVVTVKEDALVIETGAGSERVKIKITRQAIYMNNTANERFKAQQDAARAAAEKAKTEKKNKKDDIDETK